MITNAVGTEEELQVDKFTSETDEWIDNVLSSLGWTRDKVLQSEELIQCSVNHGHYVSTKSSSKHITYCILANKGYSKEEINADQSTKFFYEKAPAVVSVDLDESTVHSILMKTGGAVPMELPATIRRALMTLTAAQRLGLYEYCVEVAKAAQGTAHFDDEDLMLLEDQNAQSRDKPQSKLELLAKQRDLKRRRQSYRGKNTHTSKKSHTEVIRDVLNQQMEILASIWADEFKIKQESSLPEEDATERNDRKKGSSLLDPSNEDQELPLESETLCTEFDGEHHHSYRYQRDKRDERGHRNKRTHDDDDDCQRDDKRSEKRARRDKSRDQSDRRDRRIQKDNRLQQDEKYARKDRSRDRRVEESQQEQDERYSHRDSSRDRRAEKSSHRDSSCNRSCEVDGGRRHRYRLEDREDRDRRNEENERSRTLSSNELFIRKERSIRSVISRPSSNTHIKQEPDTVRQSANIKREVSDD